MKICFIQSFQTVNILMKCGIVRNSIWAFTVCQLESTCVQVSKMKVVEYIIFTLYISCILSCRSCGCEYFSRIAYNRPHHGTGLCLLQVRQHGRIQRGGGVDRGSGPSLKNHKNIGFLSNTGLDPLENHKTTKPAFNVGQSSARQRNAI